MRHLLGQRFQARRRRGVVAAGQQVMDALDRLARRQPGPTGPPVQLGQPLGRTPGQPLAQGGLEELVVPIPLPLRVEPEGEDVSRDEVSADLGARSGRQSGGQLRRETVEHRRIEQELLHVRGLSQEDLLGEMLEAAARVGDSRCARAW